MRNEWKDFWRVFLEKSLGGLKWSSLLCMLFFVIYLPILKPSEYWLSFKICLGYAFSVQMYLMLFLAIAMAIHVRQIIRYKVERKLKTSFYFAMTGIGSCLGLVQGIYIKSYLLDKVKPEYSEVVFSFLTGCFIAMMFIFRGLYKDAKEKNFKLKAANTEAELHVFKNQMQPHFLFNSLNSLMSLIETKNHEASKVTQNLANLYREILNNSNLHVASLESELNIVEKYLSLESLRFGDRLSFVIDKPKNATEIYLPPLVLQTLAENAVKHGISNIIDTGIIDIKIQKKDLGFEAIVTNSGYLSNMSSSKGLGIKNTLARLELIYGDKHDFKIQQIADCVRTSFWFSGNSFQ